MIHTIPAVSRVAGRGRWISSSGAYMLASTLGGVMAGILFGVIGSIFAVIVGPTVALAIIAITSCFLGLVDLGVVRGPRIERRAQVPEPWRWRFLPEISSALYGAMLGAGVFTRVHFAVFYAVVIWSLMASSLLASVVIFGSYGLFRAMPVAIAAPFMRRKDESERVSDALVGVYGSVGRVGGVLMLTIGLLVGVDVLI